MGHGALFAAVSGTREEGSAYIAEAISRGAVCVLCEEKQENVPHILVPDVRKAIALLACAFYGDPARQMTVIGVTGTNGKTTTTYLIKQLLEHEGHRVGLIGTNRNMIGQKSLPAARTTPDAITLQRLLRQMADEGCDTAVMEVSSHALSQSRVEGISFTLGVFTNLTQDHLDYHGTMEEYCRAKAKLFPMCRLAAVNGDDPWCESVLENCSCPVLRFGQKFTNDIVAYCPRYERECVRFTAVSDSEQAETKLGIPGGFSLYNSLAAITAVHALGMPLQRAAKSLALCRGVKGRAEVVPTGRDFTVLIDYAHTPDALKNILLTVCSFADGRVITVFGCGGERDRGKRAEMGRIAAELSDSVVLTSDNPRGENAYAILHDILSGMAGSKTPFAVIEERRKAISFALSAAEAGDVVLLAGKGHETYQIIGDETLPLDEREVVKEKLKL